jgi:hypothetical protein
MAFLIVEVFEFDCFSEPFISALGLLLLAVHLG